MSARLLEQFPPVATREWEAAIHKDLKGADYAKKLIWQSEEGIAVKPYYRAEDAAGLEHLEAPPGAFPYTRGTRALNEWRIREAVEAPSVAEANERARRALASGAGEIEFVLGARGFELRSAAELLQLLDGLGCPVHFTAGDRGAEVLRILAGALPAGFEGSLDYDPLAEDGIAGVVELVRAARARAPKFRPLTVRAFRFRDSGGTAVEELGYALAAGIEYMAELTDGGLSAQEAAASLAFSFAAGSSFFFEIAKLRAARMLWARALEAFGVLDGGKAAIHCRTALWNKTIYDPYVNVLRGTTEAMSAAMGGCDSLSVSPFDVTYSYSDDTSRRLARNTQLILKHEAWLDRATDPAGGSYYTEVLTDSVAQAAWKTMQEVAAAGGFSKAWKDGLIAGRIAKSRAAKEAAVSSRRRTILGTNQYPNAKERALDRIARRAEDRITPRAAEVFEAIRLRTERHAAAGGRVPVFLLLEIGNPAMRKARSGFVSNFLGCAGFEIRTETFADAASAAKSAAASDADAVVLCSSDEEYPQIAAAVCGAVRVPVIVAGYPKDAVDQLKQAGVTEFVHVRTNAAEFLAAWQQRLGVKE
ncbi:MAG TPA: methylmalonyl-CoA mutase subunit beta [Bryobacteraceae bacterium]|nr:methylmalonyl-CoA mutase subunit beta [Bryobacteraceae bacterium]